MAQIDLKNVTIKIKDGYGPSGFLVNNGGGYMAGATTILVDTGTAALVTGNTFTIASETGTPVHTITAHSETLGVTTSITFTPALAGAIANNDPIVILPHELSIKIGEGNLTYSEKRKIKYVVDRGVLDTVRLEDQEPVEVKLDFTWEFLTAEGGGTPTVEDALKKRGEASTWVSSAEDVCEPYAIDIELTNTPPCEDVDTEVITLPDFRWEDLSHDPKQAQVSVTGKCNVIEAVVARV